MKRRIDIITGLICGYVLVLSAHLIFEISDNTLIYGLLFLKIVIGVAFFSLRGAITVTIMVAIAIASNQDVLYNWYYLIDWIGYALALATLLSRFVGLHNVTWVLICGFLLCRADVTVALFYSSAICLLYFRLVQGYAKNRYLYDILCSLEESSSLDTGTRMIISSLIAPTRQKTLQKTGLSWLLSEISEFRKGYSLAGLCELLERGDVAARKDFKVKSDRLLLARGKNEEDN